MKNHAAVQGNAKGVHLKLSNVAVPVVAATRLLVPTYAQWFHPQQRTPRTQDGEPDNCHPRTFGAGRVPALKVANQATFDQPGV
jgi:hypothetical protein